MKKTWLCIKKKDEIQSIGIYTVSRIRGEGIVCSTWQFLGPTYKVVHFQSTTEDDGGKNINQRRQKKKKKTV